MKTEESSTALVPITNSYPALAGDQGVIEMLHENLGDEQLTQFDLEQIRVPSGKSMQWEVLDANGEPSATRAVEGIVVYTKIGRAMWEKGIDEGGGNTPPDCSSANGVIGIGKPGGLCEECALSKFTEDEDGNRERPKCSRRRALFLLREGTALPAVVSVPPTSMKPVKDWLMGLVNRNRGYWSVVVRLELKPARNKAGVDYAQIDPKTVRALDPKEAQMVWAYGAKTRETLKQYREGAEGTEGEEA